MDLQWRVISPGSLLIQSGTVLYGNRSQLKKFDFSYFFPIFYSKYYNDNVHSQTFEEKTMKDILVKTVMIPLSNYVTIEADKTLYDVFQILENNKASGSHAHRDAIVVDHNGNFKGKVTMLDIFRTIEPNYKKLFKNYEDGTLTKDYVINAVRDFQLWLEPMQSLCERGAGIKVSEIMHVPEDYEYLQENDSLEKALHEYVMGLHQPLIVKNGDTVTGVLRFGDLFEIIKDQMLSCPLPK